MGVWLFVLITYGSTWALNLSQRNAAAAGSPEAIDTFLFGTVWTPTLAALLLTSVVEGRRSLVRLLGSVFRVPHRGWWFATAVAVPCAVVGLALLIARAFGDSAPPPGVSLWPSIVGMQFLTGAVGEELGWRAFLVPRLTRHFGFTTGAMLGGGLWSGWHIAGAFFPGLGPHAAPLLPFLLFVTLFGVFLAFVFAGGQHLLAPILAHVSLNVTLALAGVPLTSRPFWWTLVVGAAAVAAAVVIAPQPANIALEPTTRS